MKRVLKKGLSFSAIVDGKRVRKVGPCEIDVTETQAKAFASHWEVAAAVPIEPVEETSAGDSEVEPEPEPAKSTEPAKPAKPAVTTTAKPVEKKAD